MARWNNFYGGYPEYISVGDRKRKNDEALKKLSAKNPNLRPVILKGKAITTTFWGKAWCKNIESYQDFENRLPRGRSYVRNNSVLDLQITKGQITALVAASHGNPYTIKIKIAPLNPSRWKAIKEKCTGKIQSLLDLIRGKLSSEVLELFCDHEQGLFPEPKEIKMDCSCPDWAGLCKHLAATLYGVGARLDEDPKLFFTLRGVDERELLGEGMVASVVTETPAEIADESLGKIFGIELDSADGVGDLETATGKTEPPPAVQSPKSETAKKVEKTKKTPKTAKTMVPKVPVTAKKKASTRKTSKAKSPQLSDELRIAKKFLGTPEDIREARAVFKMDTKQFARMTGFSTASMRSWELGVRSPSERSADEMRAAIKKHVAHLKK